MHGSRRSSNSAVYDGKNNITSFLEDTDIEGLMIFVEPDMSFEQVVSQDFPAN